MSLDPEVAEFLRKLELLKNPPVYTLTPSAARSGVVPVPPPYADVSRVLDAKYPGPGGELNARVYWPAEASRPSADALPLMMFYHGGGWMLADIPAYEHLCRLLANAAGCVVVSVEYRRPPEDRFPAAVEDCYAATVWAQQQAAEWGANPQQTVVCGDSAGGNLAVAVALMARDRQGPPLAYQMLIYPVTDCAFETASYLDNAVGFMLTRSAMQWFWENYLPDPQAAANPYASVLRANLEGLPPADVITAEFDPLRDEGEALAAQLQQAGVQTRLERFPGMIHGFVRRTDLFSRGRTAIQDLGQRIRQFFGNG